MSARLLARVLGAFLFIAVVPFLIGCDDMSPASSSTLPTAGDPKDPVYGFDQDDAEMNGAIQKSKDTVSQFIAALRKPSPTQVYFSVKKPFSTSDGTLEHIWLTDVSLEGSQFHGLVGNIPADVPGVQEGDPASVGTDDISDWMIVDDGRLVGGYTIRVMRNRMDAEERAEFDRSIGLIIE